MTCAPHSSAILGLGALTFAVEIVLLLITIRRSRARRTGKTGRGRHDLLSILLALGGALPVPCLVAALVSRGRNDLIVQLTSDQLPRFEIMTHPLRQVCVLRWGILASFPSLALAGMTAGAIAASRLEVRAHRILLCSAAPLVMAPFFLGVWSFLRRFQVIFDLDISWGALENNRSQIAPIIAQTLADARQSLALGAHLALFVLFVLVVEVARLVCAVNRNGDTARGGGSRGSLAASATILAAAAMVGWLTGPMAQENQSPFPGHNLRPSRRVAPPIPHGVSQRQLYELSDNTTMGFRRSSLSFPLVYQEVDDEPSRSGPRIQIAKGNLLFDGRRIWGGLTELKESVQQWRINFPLLHPKEEEGSPTLEASPTTSVDLISDVLKLVHDLGWREVRLVTGVPQTIARPIIGPISRAILQTTTVALSLPADAEPPTSRKPIRISKELRSYGDLIDQVLSARRMSLNSVVILDSVRHSHGTPTVVKRTPQILVRQQKGVVATTTGGEVIRMVLDGYCEEALLDPSLGLLWALQGNEIKVVDLRSVDPKPTTIVKRVRKGSTFKVNMDTGNHSSSLHHLNLCENSNFKVITIEWSLDPKLSFVGETDEDERSLARAKLVGREWLKLSANRQPDGSIRLLDFGWPGALNVLLPAGTGHCNDKLDCGSTVKFAETGLLLVMTKSIAGEDCRDVGCLLYDPKTQLFATPYRPTQWKRSIKMANDCGLFRFEPTGKRYYLIGDSLCEVGASCTSLGGEALGWMEPWIEVGLPTADTSVPQEPGPPLRDRLK